MSYRILLLEPGYSNKYPPLGLMKLASYHRAKGDVVRFSKGCDESVLLEQWDRIYVTTLFSFEYANIEKAIDFAIAVARGVKEKIFVGGIAASLMHTRFVTQNKWAGIRFIKGLLRDAPATSLELGGSEYDFHEDDFDTKPIEFMIPDYSILDDVEYEYPAHDSYFAYATRGCVRKCHFCGVPKLEGDQFDMPSLSAYVDCIRKTHGEMRNLVLMDNNFTASPNFKDLISEIIDMGFGKGATLKRGTSVLQRKVDFNQGLDARILAKNEVYLEEISKIAIDPLRIAFDHFGFRKVYEKSIRIAASHGLTELSNYMLYNFKDKPEDLWERMALNARLNEELGTNIYSFPMRYQPTDLPDRSHIGDFWLKYELRSIQVILQASRGVVSSNPDFYFRAFGESADAFKALIHRPHDMIAFRDYFEKGDGQAELEDYETAWSKISESQQKELLYLLGKTAPSKYKTLLSSVKDKNVKYVMSFYVPLSKTEIENIRNGSRHEVEMAEAAHKLSKDTFVEDAGLMFNSEDNGSVFTVS